MSGMKIDQAQVMAAERIVNSAVEEMHRVSQTVQAQSGLTTAAIKAPAAAIASDSFTTLGGSGKALAETLAQLQADLVRLRGVATDGSDQATQAARTGAAVGVINGM